MFIELVELLRCIREHDESWLVASIGDLRERSIITGTLGCPVCDAEYPIVGGVADFSGGASPAPFPVASGTNAVEMARRAGGFLGLGESSGVIVLGGEWSTAAPMLVQTVNLRAIVANPQLDLAGSPALGLVRIADSIPLGAGACAGIALDGGFAPSAFLSAQRALEPGARLVGPMKVQPPEGLAIIASDETWWIGEKLPEVTTLRRANR